MEDYAVYIGRPVMDTNYTVDRWPQEGSKFLGTFSENVPGGMVANSACIPAGLGYKVYLFGRMGNSDDTRFLMNDMEHCNVDTSHMELIDGMQDTKCLVFHTETERTILVLLGDSRPSPLTDEQKNFLMKAKWIYTTLPELAEYIDIDKFLKEYSENGGMLVLDNEVTSYAENWRDCMKYAHTVFMNESALEKFGEGKAPDELTDEILSLGVKRVVWSLGARGCAVTTEDGRTYTGVYDIDVVDTTGAGDTFNSSFIWATVFGRNDREAAVFATAAADMEISKKGPRTGITDEESIIQFMNSHSISPLY